MSNKTPIESNLVPFLFIIHLVKSLVDPLVRGSVNETWLGLSILKHLLNVLNFTHAITACWLWLCVLICRKQLLNVALALILDSVEIHGYSKLAGHD